MKRMLALLLAMCLVFALCACAGNDSDPSENPSQNSTKPSESNSDNVAVDTVKIGVMLPLSTSQDGSEMIKTLVDIFVEAINTTDSDLDLPFHDVEGLPNLGGAKVEVVYGDTGATADVCMTEVERLITSENVDIICGAFSSANTKTSMVPAEKYNKIIISEGTSVSLLEAGYTNFFRTFPGDDTFVQQSFEFIKSMNEAKNAGIKTLAVVCEDSEFGASIGEQIRKYAEEYGIEIVEDISYSAAATNVTSEVLRLKAADADVVMMSSYEQDALLFMRTYKEQGYSPKMLFGQRGGFQSTNLVPTLGADAEYIYSTARWAPDYNTELAQGICKKYEEAVGLQLSGDMIQIGWNLMVAACAINQAGTTDTDAVREVFHNGIEINSEQDPTGMKGYVYADNGQNTLTGAVVVQLLDGKFCTVYPFDAASKDFVYPAPAWDER
jgi:branched-chain amino acid transport system substrate-binding protein